MQYDLAKNFVTRDEQGRKNLQGRALEAMALFAPQVMALIGCLHVSVSVYLCYAFLRPLWRADRPDPAMRAQHRVPAAEPVGVPQGPQECVAQVYRDCHVQASDQCKDRPRK